MATSILDLLNATQTQVWAAWTLPPPGPDGREDAAQWRDEQLLSWPALAAAATRALHAMEEPNGQRLEPVLIRLTSVATDSSGVALPASATDFSLARAATYLGAAADALLGWDGPSRPPAEATDRILALVAFAATTTGIYTRHADPLDSRSRGWFTLAQGAYIAGHTAPAHEPHPALARPIVAVGEESLAATLDTFHRAARDALAPVGIPSPDLHLIPRVLELLHRRAAAADPTDPHHQAATAWAAARVAWRNGIHIPGPPAHPLRATAAALGAALTEQLSDDDQWQLRRYGRDGAADTASRYRDRIEDAVGRGLPVIAARRLAESIRPMPEELLAASRAGRWLPLPPASPPATSILHATATAAASPIYREAPGSTEPPLPLRPQTSPTVGRMPFDRAYQRPLSR